MAAEKWYGSNYGVIKAFVTDPFDERGGRNPQGSIYFSGNGIIYSYGDHFPMATVLTLQKTIAGFPRLRFFLVNGDGSTATTSKHRNDLFICLRREIGVLSYAVVPFSSLGQAFRLGPRGGWQINKRTAEAARDRLEVVDHKEDYWETKKVWVTDKETGKKELKDVQEHFLGATLLTTGDEYFLSGIDSSGRDPRGMYFLTKLPRPATSVSDAYEAIKPEGLNGETYIRQGEWFLVPQNGMKKPREVPLEKKVLLENRGRLERECAI